MVPTMTVYEVEFSGTARVEITDDRVILRVTENRDSQDIPEGQPGHYAAHAYRKNLYNISTREDVLEMLVWNAASNGRCQASDLDGWADLSRDAAYTSIESIFLESITDKEPS